MNQYWIILSLFLIGGIFFVGERYGEDRVLVQCDKHEAAQQENTIKAQEHVITQVQTQGKITQETENAYHTGITAIDSLYSTARVQSTPPAGADLRSIPTTAAGIQTSRKYHLTPKQCDREEEKCNALWNWAQSQAAVK